jgi:hypothetical protein
MKEYAAVLFTGTIVSVAAEYEIKKTDEELSAFYLVVADVCAKTEQLWYERELKNDEYEGSETDRVVIIVGQSSSARNWASLGERTSFDKDIVLSPELQGVSGAIMSRQPSHLSSLVGGQTYARSLILVFPDGPKINQEQPIRNALSSTTVTFNTSYDIVGPPWAAVYI